MDSRKTWRKNAKFSYFNGVELEARSGFEPLNKGFADLSENAGKLVVSISYSGLCDCSAISVPLDIYQYANLITDLPTALPIRRSRIAEHTSSLASVRSALM